MNKEEIVDKNIFNGLSKINEEDLNEEFIDRKKDNLENSSTVSK